VVLQVAVVVVASMDLELILVAQVATEIFLMVVLVLLAASMAQVAVVQDALEQDLQHQATTAVTAVVVVAVEVHLATLEHQALAVQA
jgi:hypothetical protein